MRPPGFTRHDHTSPLTDPWEPIYAKEIGEWLIVGLELAQAHANSRGFAHGGLLAAIADNTLGANCKRRFSPPVTLLTINLSIDYQGVAKIGNWISFEPQHVQTGKTICFANLLVKSNDIICARANATFRVIV